MKKILIFPIFAILALVIIASPIYNANAQTITCGQEITQSVTLESDLNCMDSGTDGMSIDANNIVLDCAGHTITGPISSSPAMTGLNGITLVHANGVTVKNCHVVYFDNGFVLRSNSSNNNLVSDKADNNGNYGFDIASNSNNNQITNGQASHNGGYGFIIESSSGKNQLDNNLSSGNTRAGFVALTSSNDNTFENDTSYENLQDGFIISSSSGDVLKSSQAIGNTYSGFALFGSNGVNLDNNTSVGNGMVGYLLLVSANNTLANNGADTNDQDGFLADSGSIGNTYDDNQCENNHASASSPTGLCSQN